MSKKDRHDTITDLILSNEISSQEILLNLLIKKGFDVTQATLSRDMKELKIVKAPNNSGDYVYQLSDNDRNTEEASSANLSAYGFLSIEFSGNLAVIKTRPGYAMAIAGEIDKKAAHSVLGTVAGDDTILLIPKENISRKGLVASLSKFISTIQ